MKIHNTILPSKVKPKYKDVELVSLSDTGYQIQCKELFNQRLKSKNGKKTLPLPRLATDVIAKQVEKLFQNKFQSSFNRILAFNVHFRGNYLKQFRELDIVKVEKDGTLVIGEVKLTNNYKCALKKAIEQLSHSMEILSVAFSKITPIIIIVDLSNENLTNYTAVEKITINDYQYTKYTYSYMDVKRLIQSQQLEQLELLEKAHIEAMDLAHNRAIKEEVKLLNKTERNAVENSTLSEFGFLLQQKLQLGSCALVR